MKKIALVLRLFQEKNFHGGGEKLFSKLILGFIQKGDLVDIYCSKSDIESFDGVNKIVLIDENYDHNDPLSMEKFYQKAKKLIDKEHYDHVISENITPPMDITFLQGHSLINRFKAHKNLFEKFIYKFRPVKIQRIKYQKKWMEQGYNKIFVPSNALKQDIINNFGINENKINIIYPGVEIPSDVETIENKPLQKPLVFGLSAPGFKIKGGFVFLKALSLLKAKDMDFKAKIIYPKFRKNWGVKLLLKLYGIEKNIEFLGFQKDMQNFYKSIDIVVIPSIEDSFGLVALEAMANKKVCLISSNAGASELIQDNDNGFVYEMSQHGATNLAKKMEFIIKNKSITTKMTNKVFDTAKKFNWDKTFLDFYARLTENTSNNS